MKLFAACAIASMALAGPGRAQDAGQPVFSASGPDASVYGAGDGYAVGTRASLREPRFMVGAYSHWDSLFSFHPVPKAPLASPLKRALPELSLFYHFRDGDFSLQDYLDRNPTTGMLIGKDDTILFEHYQYGRTDQHRLVSQSMAKTVTAMLVGIAVSEGAIRSIDEAAQDYVPGLAGTEIGTTSIRALLHMASGIEFTETYEGPDDAFRFGLALFGAASEGPVAAIRQFNTRVAAPDSQFHYAGLNTETLGLIVANATHMSLADYLESRIWAPMGAEADATWAVDRKGQEAAYCCFSATLRDYARFGLLLAHGGWWNGKQIIPRQWVIEATTPDPAYPFLEPGSISPRFGYGYQVWLLKGERRMFALFGIHGQRIFVDPVSKLVLVHTAVRVKPNKDPAEGELIRLWLTLVKQQGG